MTRQEFDSIRVGDLIEDNTYTATVRGLVTYVGRYEGDKPAELYTGTYQPGEVLAARVHWEGGFSSSVTRVSDLPRIRILSRAEGA